MENPGEKNKGSEKANKLLAMFLKRELFEKQPKELVEIILSLQLELNNERTEREKIQQILDSAKKTSNTDKTPFPNYAGYDKNKSWVDKVCFILKKHAELMSFSQIKDALIFLEPDVKNRWSDPDNYISQVLRQAIQRELVIKVKDTHCRSLRYQLSKRISNLII